VDGGAYVLIFTGERRLEKAEKEIIENSFVWTRDIALSSHLNSFVVQCIFFPFFVFFC